MTTRNLYQVELIAVMVSCLFLAVFSLPALSDPAKVQKLIADGNLNEALRLTNSELARDSNNISYRFLQGLILTRQEKLEQARDVFIGITRSNPELPEPYNNLAVIYASMGDFDNARQALEQAINTHPAYATAHENLGDIYAKLASQAYNQALELDKENNKAKTKLSLVNELFFVPQTDGEQPIQLAESGAQTAGVPVEDTQQQLKERQEAAQQEAAKQEAARQEIARQEAAKQEAARQEATRREVARQEAARQEAAQRQEAARQETARQEVVKQEVTRQEAEQRSRMQDAQQLTAVVKQTVIDWSLAWSARDINTYLSMYANDFTPPDGRTFEQWRLLRQKRLGEAGAIKVTIADLVVEMTGSGRAQATFTQNYQSDIYSDRVKKTLLLKLQNSRWLITQEQTR